MANLSNINNKFLVTTGGNVGIGTTSPGTKLDVGGPGNFLGTAVSGAALVTIENNSGSTATSYGLLVKGGGNSSSGKTFEVRDDSGNTDLIVKGNGNVGIGTSTPGDFDGESRNLVIRGGVNGSTPTIGMTIATDGDQASSGRCAIRFADGINGNERYRGALEYNHNGDDMSFRTAGTQKMTLTDTGDLLITSGKVGIGTASPSTALHLDQPSNDRAGGLYIERDGSNYGLSAFVDSGGYGIIGSNGNYTNDIITMNLSNSNVVFSGNGTFDTVLNVIAPDNGGSPAMTSTINMHGYEGRGVGIKMKDNVTTSGGGTDREWFIGTGYNTTGFNIGYASDGSQSSYAAQRKLFIYPGGNIDMGNTNMTDARFRIMGANSGTNPAATAHMASAVILQNAQGSDGSFSGIDFHNSSDLVDSRIVGIHTNHSFRYGELAFLTHNGSSLAEKMRISRDGYVGIGTTAPAGKLEVKQGHTILGGTQNNYGANVFTTKLGGYGVLSTGTDRYGSYGWLTFNSNNNYTGAARVFAFTNGYKANEFALLMGTSDQAPPTLGAQGVVTNGQLIFHVNNSADFMFGKVAGDGNGPHFQVNSYGYSSTFQGSSTANMVTYKTGTELNTNVGALVFRDNGNDYCGQITVNGTTNTTSYLSASDYRLKEDLKDFNGIDLVDKIPVYNFKWKKENVRTFGVLAHELKEVLPLVVDGDKDEEKYQTVDYSKIVPVLIKAIQELKAEIDELKK